MTTQTPTTYFKKPVPVEVMQWDGSPSGATPIIDWILSNGGTATYWCDTSAIEAGVVDRCPGTHSIRIATLEGDMNASPGDFIIRGVKGEFYPCKPDIFVETYDALRVPPQLSEPDEVQGYLRARGLMEERFITAAGGEPPTEDQHSAVIQFQQLAVELATAIEQLAPNGRNKSLALTHLEDVLMRANRAIFATGPSV